MSLRLTLIALTLAVVPACSTPPQCVIDNDCPLGQYCSNPPGGAGGSCMDRGAHDTGARADTGPAVDVGDTGPRGDTGPAMDTGPAVDTGPAMDTGPAVDASRDAGHDTNG